MKRISNLLLVLLLSAIGNRAFSQEPGQITMKLNYNIAKPLGSFKNDFISKTSYRGGSGEIAYWFNPKFSLGVGVGYQSYDERFPRQVYKLEGNQSVSAVVSNAVETMPVTVNATFLPAGGSAIKLQPYLSVGAGVNLVSYSQYLGEFSNVSTNNAAFTAQGGAGLIMPIAKIVHGASVQVGANYNYTPYKRNGLSSLNRVGFNAGIMFPLR